MSITTAATIDLSHVHAAIGRLQRAEEEVARAKASFDEARSALAGALAEAFDPFRDGRVELPDGLVRELYWDREEIRVTDLARALRTSTSALAELAGPITVAGRCDRCGGPAEGEKRTRTARVHLRCQPCVDAQDRAEEEARQQLEVREALRDLVAEWEREGELPYRYNGRW